jgi:hypothetical protein
MSHKLLKRVALSAVSVAVLGGAVLSSTPAMAANTNVTFNVIAGALNITVAGGGTTTLSNVTLNTTNQNSTGSFSTVYVSDATGSGNGWTASIKLKNLAKSGNTNFILLANETGATTKYLSLVMPADGTAIAEDSGSATEANLTYYTFGTGAAAFTALSALDQTGETNSMTMLSATAGNGAGGYTFNVPVTLTVPAFGNYPNGQTVLASTGGGTAYTGQATLTVV